jgi:hypothetical protein
LAKARHEVGVAQAGAEPLRHGFEQLVADRVAERIVDAFEVIEVKAMDRQRLAAAAHAR